MAHLLDIPENVMIQHVLPFLDHSDLLRLRRVSKETKAMADACLWTPKPGHQGKWELEIDSEMAYETLEAFLKAGPPPPSRLRIYNYDDNNPSEANSFFQSKHLEEFLERYGKYVTQLRFAKLFFPLTSAEEIHFYESLVNLEKLGATQMITVGGVAQFEEKTRNAQGSFIIRPSLKKLKSFDLCIPDCLDSMWNFINGVSNNLEKLKHPFQRTRNVDGDVVVHQVNFAPIHELIERRGGTQHQAKLVYDWRCLTKANVHDLLRLFASCVANGVIIKTLWPLNLKCIFRELSRRTNRKLAEDPAEAEWVVKANSERYRLIGSVIHSLEGLNDFAILPDLPALQTIVIPSDVPWPEIPGDRCIEWPNLKALSVVVRLSSENRLCFLQGGLKIPKLEELSLEYNGVAKKMSFPLPMHWGISCGNVKKFRLFRCPEKDDFFLMIWEQLPLLEEVNIYSCLKLTDKGFVGEGIRGSLPAFLNLKKLKHLAIQNLEFMRGITDEVFTDVFRHLNLSTLELSSRKPITNITVTGIKELLTGPFAETIQRLKLDELQLQDISSTELVQVASCFRSSKML